MSRLGYIKGFATVAAALFVAAGSVFWGPNASGAALNSPGKLAFQAGAIGPDGTATVRNTGDLPATFYLSATHPTGKLRLTVENVDEHVLLAHGATPAGVQDLLAGRVEPGKTARIRVMVTGSGSLRFAWKAVATA